MQGSASGNPRWALAITQSNLTAAEGNLTAAKKDSAEAATQAHKLRRGLEQAKQEILELIAQKTVTEGELTTAKKGLDKAAAQTHKFRKELEQANSKLKQAGQETQNGLQTIKREFSRFYHPDYQNSLSKLDVKTREQVFKDFLADPSGRRPWRLSQPSEWNLWSLDRTARAA